MNTVAYENIMSTINKYSEGSLLSIESMSNGTANVLYKVCMDEGIFVLRKRNKLYSNKKFVDFENEFLIFLSQNGLPVPVPILNNDGEYSTFLDDSTYQLYPYIDGDLYNFQSDLELEESAVFLSKFHNVTSKFTPSIEKKLPRYDDPKLSLENLDRFTVTFKKIGKDEKKILDFVRDRLVKLAEEFTDNTYDSLPLIYVHGDYHPANVKFRSGKISGLFDFDWVSLQPRISDLVDGILYFSSKRYEQLTGSDIISLVSKYDLDIVRAGIFIKAYCRSISVRISDDEIKSIPYLIYARLINNRVDALRKVTEDQKIHLLTYRIQDLIGWLDDNKSQLINLFRK